MVAVVFVVCSVCSVQFVPSRFTLHSAMASSAAMVAQMASLVKAMQKASADMQKPLAAAPAAKAATVQAAAAAGAVGAPVAYAYARAAAAETTASESSSAAAAARGNSACSGAKRKGVLEYIAANRNPGTRKSYGSSWAGFARYLEKHRIEESKLDEFDVADYLRVRAEEHGVAAATLGNDRAAIADRLKNTDRKHVVHTSVVADMMAVLRTQAAPSKPKQHMAAELMRELVETHDARGPSGSPTAWLKERDIFLMLLMMMAFLREAEAVALTPADVDVKTLRVQGKLQQVLHVFIARSKTDQAKVGHVVLLGGDANNPACCPVRRYARYVAAVKAAGVNAATFFPTVSGTAMSSSTPCGIVQRAVKQANAEAEAGGFGVDRWGDPEAYGSHSLRRGGVTTARANGVSMLDIQKHGRWKSLTVFSYVGTTAAEQLAVTNSFLGEAKSVVEGALDEVPSRQAHALKAGSAAAGGAKPKPRAAGAAAAAASSSTSGPASRCRKRRPEADVDGEEGEEEETEAHQAMDEEEDALLTAACSQGWKDDEEEIKAAGRKPPARAAKAKAATAGNAQKKQRQ